jgi:hypothetical protein
MMIMLTREPTRTQEDTPVTVRETPRNRLPVVWAIFVIAAIGTLPVLSLTTWSVAVSVAAVVLLAATARMPAGISWAHRHPDRVDLAVLILLYVAVVGMFRIAFTVFTTDNVPGLFLTFAGGLLLGVGVPVWYSIWIRRRPLRSLGLGGHALRPTLALALVFGCVQFVIMFWGYSLPAPVNWVPLLVMSLTVGLFEAVFFRGFIQGRLEESFGTVPGVVGAATLYALYHVGYGMNASEIVFLFGLGIVYAIAYRLVNNILVLWPLLTPIGAFFNNIEAGDIELPWASIAGFANLLAVMAMIIWLAARHQRRIASAGLVST